MTVVSVMTSEFNDCIECNACSGFNDCIECND